MFHKSELGDLADGFPQDSQGNIPHTSDHWRQMKFDHGARDPDEEGISEAERQSRLEYLDQVWWPQVLAKAAAEHDRLLKEQGESYVQRWQRLVNRTPDEPHGFEVE